MARPQKERLVENPPLYNRFKPAGISASKLESITLTLDEYEALRLTDYTGMDHKQAAEEMEVSRPTFSRLIEKARKKLVEMLVNGKQLYIDGGNIHFRDNIIKCNNCGHTFNIRIQNNLDNCPSCGSKNIIDLAGGFGHGKCCGRRGKK